MVHLVLILFLNHAHAQNVQQAACIRPSHNPKAEVGAIYLHGWFQFGGSSDHIALERNNRAQLQQLANTTGMTIAVPLADGNNGQGERSWNPDQRPGSAAVALQRIEAKASAACGGARLAVPRKIIGFSDGGYMAREIGLQCAAKKPQYSVVMMAGARARNGSSANRGNCAKFLAIRGASDNSTDTCVAKSEGKCVRSIPFYQTARSMMSSLGGNAEVLPPYRGGHELPPNSVIAAAFGSAQVAENPPVTISTGTPTAPSVAVPPAPRPPQIPHGSGGFLFPDAPAGR